MAKIQVLPDLLAHKIAAGEVVERPASVVKELIENALDAQAKQILVTAEDGGKRLLSVRDDGHGMSREDAQLAFQHHATSKIHEFDDLSRLQTLGFRGEALPSIASVSHLRMRTIDGDTETPLGTELELEGGIFQEVRETAWPRGTEIAVRDLFFNVPARRKFLKRASTELTRVSRQIAQYALAYPEVEFGFIHQQRSILEAPRVRKLEDRVYQVLGGSFLENLVPIDYRSEGIRLSGYTSVPHEQRSNSNSLYLYVNRRAVRDRILSHAIRLAYKDLMPSGTFPVVVLFVELDPSEVDVNVHPTKTEIRFHRPNSIYRAMHHGIRGALLGHKQSFSQLARGLPPSNLVEVPAPSFHDGRSSGTNPFSRPGAHLDFAGSGADSFAGTEPNGPLRGIAPPEPAHAGEIPETHYLGTAPVVLGQLVESFVVCADREGILMVDQHVAHERILYDQALDRIESAHDSPTQRLLVPVTFDLSPQQASVAGDTLEELNRCGFEIDWFGPHTLAIKGVPAVANGSPAQELVTDILDGLAEEEFQTPEERVRRLREQVAITLSCRSAIKINTPLSHQKMQWLLDELFRTQNPFTCPHGRPIVLRMGIEEILRGFKRI